jgi:hypothetical protein
MAFRQLNEEPESRNDGKYTCLYTAANCIIAAVLSYLATHDKYSRNKRRIQK